MVGDPDDERQERRQGSSGHRSVPRAADVRIEAWGTSRERCMAEAVLGVVECFVDVGAVRPRAVERIRLAGASDDDLLSALLDEVVGRLETYGEVPVDVEADATDDGLDVRLAVARPAGAEGAGALPRNASWHELRIAPDAYGWSCAVTVDVM
ncbi:archease [Streptomyces sp. NPDC020996]|uniref:archease n=1 Tax=Streptomyces sp. NPDC020996 TaxID=3154791 RepID=UPI0033D6B977